MRILDKDKVSMTSGPPKVVLKLASEAHTTHQELCLVGNTAHYMNSSQMVSVIFRN